LPPLGLLVLFLFAPAVTAWITSRTGPEHLQEPGVVGAVTLATASAVWVAVNRRDANVFAVMASFVVTFS
jgi:hypothetical protein